MARIVHGYSLAHTRETGSPLLRQVGRRSARSVRLRRGRKPGGNRVSSAERSFTVAILLLLFVCFLLPADGWCQVPATENSTASPDQPTQQTRPPRPPASELRGLVGDPAKHVLAPGDVIEINIVALPTLPTSYPIRIDGSFFLAPIGDVQAAGKTLPQLEQELKSRLGKEMRRPQFRLGLKDVAPNRMTILGEVLQPGSYQLRPGSTVLDLIASAGGLTERADASEGQLIRSTGQTTISLSPGTATESAPQLKDGDVLFIQSGTKVNVTGEVFNPGLLSVPRREGTPMQALIRAGGPKPNASLGRVILFRPALTSTVTLDLSAKAPPLPEIAHHLEDGDVLVVPPRQAVVVFKGPKAVPLRGGENVLDVIIAAGVGENLNDVTIVRSQHVQSLATVRPEDFSNPAKVETLHKDLAPEKVDLTRYFETRNPALLVPINDGDIVLVPDPGPPGGFMQSLATFLSPLQLLLSFGYFFR